MDYIPSPYNFVPLSKHVFFPKWSEQTSMDIPFSDGISGTLEIKVTAKTPLYIRNGGAHPEDSEQRRNDPNYTDFFRVFPEGPYAIPGTSFKGMLRNVIEIASFSKIAGSREKSSRVSEHRYAIRDLYNSDYTSEITERTSDGYRPKVRAGWLKRQGNNWEISLCDFARVEQEDLGNFFNLRAEHLGSRRGPAENKYRQISPYTSVKFICGGEKSHHHSCGNLQYKKVEALGRGDTEGIIVFTGQPSPRDGKSGKKHMEFIFFDKAESSIPVDDTVRTEFEFTHSELGEKRKPNKEWEFWQEHLKEGKEIPVFVLLDEKNTVKSMGLALMYRLPYTYSILDTVEHTSADHLDGDRLDFGETLFGRVENKDALRGRVAVETLLAQGSPSVLPRVDTVLSAPKPTYYPNYVKQNTDAEGMVANGRYNTFMKQNAEIRGWKRYVTQREGDGLDVLAAPSENVKTCFQPLPAGTVFSGSIHVHNVKPVELGAILWALQWGGDTALRHSLGMAKPYGFGAVSVRVENSGLAWCDPGKEGLPSPEKCQEDFIETMTSWLASMNEKTAWGDHENLLALKAMANPASIWKNELRYPVLGQGRGQNEFLKYKARGSESALLPPIPEKKNKAASGKSKKIAEMPAPKPSGPVDKFLAEVDTLSVNKIPDRLKKYKLSPETVTPEEKAKIYDKLAKKEGIRPNTQKIVDRWK